MRRLFIVFFAAMTLFPLAAGAQQPLHVHAWVDYFPAWLHEEFTKETGIPIVPSIMADNRTLYRTLSEQKGLVRYDVIAPSSEMLQQLAAEGLLMPLDRAGIPNMEDIDPWFKHLAYDDGNIYNAPLFWGALGIVLDRRVLAPEAAARIKGYKDLWDPALKGRLLLPNDFRSLMSVMLLSLGYSVNDFEKLPQAMRALESLMPSVVRFDSVDQLESMRRKTTAAGVVWARKGYEAIDAGKAFTFIFAEEGSPIWVDTLAVPQDAVNPKAAFAFINFVLRPDILARLSESSGYAVAGRKARQQLPKDLRDNHFVYPPDALRKGFEPELMLPPSSDALVKRWNQLRDSR